MAEVVHEVAGQGILVVQETLVEAIIVATGGVTTEMRGIGEDSGMIAHRVVEEMHTPVDMIAATDTTGRSMIAQRMILAVAPGEEDTAGTISIGVEVRWEWADAIRELGKYRVGVAIGISRASIVGGLVGNLSTYQWADISEIWHSMNSL